jgi:hypothetical protein
VDQSSPLPHQIFKNNPEIIAIWLHQNKISSITPDFFNNLNNLFISVLKIGTIGMDEAILTIEN